MSNIKIQTSSDIVFTGKITATDFNSIISKFDLVGSLMALQKLSAIMGNQIRVNINLEFEFHASPNIKKKAGMLTRDFISFASKHVLLNCKTQKAQYNDIDLMNLIYLYGNMEIDLHQMESREETKEKGWLWVIRSANHQWYYLRLYSNIIARYYWIFSKIFTRKKDFGEKLDSVLGISIFGAMKIGACIYANYSPREDGTIATSFLLDSYTKTTIVALRPLLTEQNIMKYFDIFAITKEQFIKECEKYEVAEDSLKKYEFNPLKRFPVIKTGSVNKYEQYIIPSLSEFLYGAFEGLYYVLLDKLDQNDKEVLFQEIGSIFELYVGELLKQHNIDMLSRAIILPEITYTVSSNEWRSADWLLVSDEYIFQIECKKRKIDNYSKAGIQGENGVGIDTLMADIAKELDKITKKEKHICENKVNGISYKGQKILNLVVFLDEMFGINKFARENIKEKMEEKNDNFYILGCWEFELICQQCKDKQQNLFYSIQDLVAGRTEIYRIDYLDRIYNGFFDKLKSGQ